MKWLALTIGLCFASSADAYSFRLEGTFSSGCCSSSVNTEFLGLDFALSVEIDESVADSHLNSLRGVYEGAVSSMSLVIGTDVYAQQNPLGLIVDLGGPGGWSIWEDRLSMTGPGPWDVTLNGTPSDRLFSFGGTFGGAEFFFDDSLSSANIVKDGYTVRMVTPLGGVSGVATATLVPEPSTALLMGLWLAGLAACRGPRCRT